MRTATA
ncbi:hypothetical protein D027_4034A, partial [Vibrio parahaemolyticus 861]